MCNFCTIFLSSSLSLLIFLVFSLCLKDHIINWLLTIKDRRPFFDLYRSRKSKQFVIITISTLLTHTTQINRIFLNIYVLHIYTIHIYCMILLCLLHEYIMWLCKMLAKLINHLNTKVIFLELD